ncbi:hypothetical protein QNH39_07020 [Neobacillus novalis]|uniref:NACHT domain-containing protein n=1 Tax=Neobacillus novalis TaxID=220687 RepID=A0AA95MNZ7_9BACI|nr:hypothetical protein [Neobacillus novalis]WHY87574.1 hypothetical protein QNH39_07020 [Neobacillus novalis]
MPQIDWSKLGLNGESKQKTFEDLCMHLFCRDLKVSKIYAYQNQPGIETEPVKVKGKKYGFQAKLFESKFDWQQIKKSIDKAIENYPDINKIYIYSNKDRTLNGSEKTETESDIEKRARAKKIKIEYITDKTIINMLLQPSNLDLAQLYFGIGDHLSFIKNSVNHNLSTFIQSSEYLHLPIVDIKKNQIESIADKILSLEQMTFLVLGNPGSGKSILIHKLLQVFGGLDKSTEDEMLDVLITNNAIPILVNLKNCATESFENIIRSRKNDSKVNNQEFNFIYLFDGLDELSEEISDKVLYQIYELAQKNNTCKIIFSCRLGNLNRMKAKTYFNDMIEYEVADLNQKYIDEFFKVKGDETKIKIFKQLKNENRKLMSEIKDILLIRLLWDTIEELDSTSTLLDLFSKKIDSLIDNPQHKKNIEELNLLNPKKEAIVELNQDISFEYQKRFQFSFSQKDLQDLIMEKYERIDYQSINKIINYMADLFFENSYLDNINAKMIFIYQHRRYQEYFFTQRLKMEYEKNPKILRELRVLSNREYLEELFLKYMRREYIKENNLPGLVELNLIDTYLGKNNSYGVDDDYYISSERFIPALISQNQENFNELFEDETLKIKDNLLINLTELTNQINQWNKDKNNYDLNSNLKKVWENGVPFLIRNIVLLWRAKKVQSAEKLIVQLETVKSLYNQNKIVEHLKKINKGQLNDPIWEEFESWIYYQIKINGVNVNDIYKQLIRKNSSRMSEVKGIYNNEEHGKEKLVKSFLRVCLQEKKEDIFELINQFDEYEFLCFLGILISKDYLSFFVTSYMIHSKIKSFVTQLPVEVVEKNSFILFYKKFFDINLSLNEINVARESLDKLEEKRGMDWVFYGTHINFAMFAFVLEKYTFEKFFKPRKGYSPHFYNELGLYSVLFTDFVSLLKGKKDIRSIVRDYIRYIDLTKGNEYGYYLKNEISYIWANIFAKSHIDYSSLNNLKNILIKKDCNIIPFSFYQELFRLNTNMFNALITESELKPLEESLISWSEDFPSFVDRCFDISAFFSNIDTNKSKFYFLKAINEGILRHGWHKDIIISYLLTDALRIIWDKNWVSKEVKKQYAVNVFNLTLRVSEITDGDHTWRGPYIVIDIVSSNDLELAEEFQYSLKTKSSKKISSLAISPILLSKVKSGFRIEEIEKGMEDYDYSYDYEGKPKPDYFEQKFVIYLAIAECELYTDEEKKIAFQKAYEQVERVNNYNLRYAFRDEDFRIEKDIYEKLCKKYNKPINLELSKQGDNKKKPKITEDQFIEEIKNSNTKKQLQGKFKKLNNYNNGIVLKKYKSWEILVNKNYDVFSNIELFLNYLKENHFPSTDFWTTNSEYLHLGLAVALKDVNTRQETLTYLYENSGHGGFVNIIKAYSVLNDKNNCLALFDRYLKFCDLIVN